MLSNIWTAFGIAIQNIRSNILHTFLSTLGIVIGVAALVAILSLADGMEEFARDQITKTTSLKSIRVQPQTRKFVNGIWVNLDNYPRLQPDHINALLTRLDSVESMNYTLSGGTLTRDAKSREIGIEYYAVLPDIWQLPDSMLIAGKSLPTDNNSGPATGVVVNENLARALAPDSGKIESALGTSLSLFNQTFEIIGVGKSQANHMQALLTMGALPDSLTRNKPANLTITATKLEAVSSIKADVEGWLKETFRDQAGQFHVVSNEWRLKQAQRGMLLFRIVMGLITGISVLVGGIGIMNVLLISITERTSEIGIRKAVGAKKSDILLQFLSESVTVSAFGSGIGVIAGFGFMAAAVPLIHYITDIQFQAAYTFSTIGIVALIALLIGVLFGTYPAMRAANLLPIDAIRRE
jgi:putative ABC transport system permease protein